MNRTLALALALALGCAMALRLPYLNERPMHNDEAVNAIKFGQLWEQGSYKYDPNEHHGPTIYYATLVLGRITAAPDFEHYTENRLRLVTVLFGLGCLLSLPFLADGLGQNGTAWAGVFLALSPAMVFYSRYFIHEMLLVFFTAFSLAAGWRYWRSRHLAWALAAGAGLGLMVVTKETFVMTLAAVVIALWLNHTWNRLLDASGIPVHAPKLLIWHLAAALGICLVVMVLFFSSFFTNASGLMDAIRTFEPWIKRAGGETPHIHAWNFYLHRLLFFHARSGPVWTEAFVMVLAVVGAVCGFRRRHLGGANASFVRFIALYTLLLTAFYSLLAYKTPWCLLNFWLGAVFLAGVGASALLQLVRSGDWKVPLVVGLLIGSGHLAWQSWQQDTTYAADQRNPYVYAQTSPDLLNLVTRVQALASVSPQREQMLIKVMAPEEDYWPLPWYLRQFKQVGWWDKVPQEPFASVMIVSSKLQASLDAGKTHLMVRYYALRPQVLLELYVEKQLWTDWLAKRPRQLED